MYGFVRCASAVPKLKVADCKYNTGEIIKLINAASQKDVELLVFPELCITGYTCADLYKCCRRMSLYDSRGDKK